MQRFKAWTIRKQVSHIGELNFLLWGTCNLAWITFSSEKPYLVKLPSSVQSVRVVGRVARCSWVLKVPKTAAAGEQRVEDEMRTFWSDGLRGQFRPKSANYPFPVAGMSVYKIYYLLYVAVLKPHQIIISSCLLDKW